MPTLNEELPTGYKIAFGDLAMGMHAAAILDPNGEVVRYDVPNGLPVPALQILPEMIPVPMAYAVRSRLLQLAWAAYKQQEEAAGRA